MSSAFSTFLMIAAAFGGGAAMLKASGTIYEFRYTERLAISFALGLGVIGWIVFFLALTGNVGRLELRITLFVLSSGLILLKPPIEKGAEFERSDLCRIALMGSIVLVMGYDVLEGLAPPADGDSLAYHFALSKAFLNAGKLFPVYQAIEGTIPLLQQMTYLAALGVGGEQVMTLWTMASGWGAGALLYVVARRFLDTNWSLAVTLIFMSTPAVIYGAGSGQIEVRNASFVLVTALAVSEARRTNLLRYAVLAGIAAGFFVASKYTGLIFAFSSGVFLLFQRRWFHHGLAYSIALLVAGGQWYGWNMRITGDPIFPILFGKLEYLSSVPWNEAIHAAYEQAIQEKSVAVNPLGFLIYPIKATLFADSVLESLRIGLGPIGLLLTPFAFLGAWHFRYRLRSHPLTIFGAICLTAYAMWFFLGPSQRIRHLLPLYPLLLLCFSVATIRLVQVQSGLKLAVCTVFTLVIPLQLIGATVFALNYIRFVFSDESREEFLVRNVSEYEAVSPTNEKLGPNDRLLVSTRQLVYYFEPSVFYANPLDQAVIELHPKASDPQLLWNQLRQQNITHMLLPFEFKRDQSVGNGNYSEMAFQLQFKQCLQMINSFSTMSITSRTLPALGGYDSRLSLVKLTPNSCEYEKG